MARQARHEYLDPLTIQIVHCIQRCVRRAFLCGTDPVSGRCHEHRKKWIRDRMEFLASNFGVDCLTFSVMSNHMHIVLRSRPDVVRQWTDEQVVRRWLKLFPGRRDVKTGEPAKVTQAKVNMILNNPERVAELRIRLSDISWWMGCLAEQIARMANREDECTGRFWEGRFKGGLILDEASILACSMYVDLNPIRAALAETPEESMYTGAKERLDDLKQRAANKGKSGDKTRPRPTDRWERSRRRILSGWMSPLEIDEKLDPVGADISPCGRRASLKGFLSISLTAYLELLDWTGRQLRSDKRGAIPKHLAPILQRVGIDSSDWCELVSKFGRLFKRAVGNRESLAQEATRRGQGWMQAPGSHLLSGG